MVTNGDSGKLTKCWFVGCWSANTSDFTATDEQVFSVSHPGCVFRSAAACLQINYKQALDIENNVVLYCK